MGEQEDPMLTFRQKIQLNNDEHLYFRKEVDSWRDEMQTRQDRPTNLEDISNIESSDDEENHDPGNELMKKGIMFLEKGEWARAISMFTAAISKKRTPKYYTVRALAHLKRRNLVEAENDCTEAINLDPSFTKAFIRRALARKLLGKCKESCDDLEIIMKLDPDTDIVAIEYEAMLDYLQQNLSCNEESNVSDNQEVALKLKRLGNDLLSKCKYKEATVKFTSAIKLNPKEPTFYANRAICHMKLKDFVSAEKDCSEALQLDGKYAKVYLRRARVRKCLRKLYESKEDFNSTFELTRDEKVLEELKEVESFIKQIEAHRRTNAKGAINLKNDETGKPNILQSDNNTTVNTEFVNHEAERMKIAPVSVGVTQNISNNGCPGYVQQTNTIISIPTPKFDNGDQGRPSKYEIREVFPLKLDDPSVKFSGPFIRVRIEDGRFASPDKLLEIPDELMRDSLPR